MVKLTLGPGRASLLRITYLQWQKEIIAGRLEHSNQRKIVWDPYQRRFHATYMLADNASRIDSVCYRRSKVMTDTSGSILWCPDEYVLSITTDPQDSIIFNRHPSLTIRRTPTPSNHPPGTAISVVWSAHRVPVTYAARQILLRTLWSPDDPVPPIMNPVVEVVDSAVYGHPSNRWGTPVISRADGADIIAWSDSIDGIVASARVIPNLALFADWWKVNLGYTDTAMVSSMYGSSANDTRGRYPSVPTFAHINSRDSNVAIVWEQPINGFQGTARRSDIYYVRLKHTKSAGVDTLIAVNSTRATVSTMAGVHRNPSISQNQDAWRGVQDVVAWETTIPFFGIRFVTVRSVYSETRVFNTTDQPDTVGSPPQLWGWASRSATSSNLDWLYPNVASLTYRDSSDTRKSMSTITYRSRRLPSNLTALSEMSYQWADIALKSPRRYSYEGDFPTNSETPSEQRTRHALLYESDLMARPRLRTSREFFFARARPMGYTAEGRVLSLRMNSTAGNGFSYFMLDPWVAGNDSAYPIAMLPRDTSQRTINALNAATSLLRTKSFSAGDSTVVGLTISAAFHGDTAGYSGKRATYVVELVNAGTAQRVHLLDSFRISTVNPTHTVRIADTLDLVSGNYYIRTTLDTVGISVPMSLNDSRYPVGEVSMEIIDSMSLFRARKLPVTGRTELRVTAHPNPASSSSEIRFTVPKAADVIVTLSDHDGRSSQTLLEQWMEPGRYALDIDLSGVSPGRYIVGLHVGADVGIAKIVVEK